MALISAKKMYTIEKSTFLATLDITYFEARTPGSTGEGGVAEQFDLHIILR